MSSVRVAVPLKAIPQGSKRHVGNGVLVEQAGEALKVYRDAVALYATRQMRNREPFSGAVGIAATFVMQRPKSHYHRNGVVKDNAPRCCYPCMRGDIDKLLRSTLDALTGVVYLDDRQVVTLVASVLWGDEPATHIVVSGVDDNVDAWLVGVSE